MHTGCIFVASNFVINSQIFIFSVFNIASFPHTDLQIIFLFTVLLLVYFCYHFVAPEICHCSVVNNQHAIQRRGQDVDKNTQIHSAYTVSRVEELQSVHLKCNLFAFSSISGIIA